MADSESFFPEVSLDRTPYRSCFVIAAVGLLFLGFGGWATYQAGHWIHQHLPVSFRIAIPKVQTSSVTNQLEEQRTKLQQQAEQAAQKAVTDAAASAEAAAQKQVADSLESAQQQLKQSLTASPSPSPSPSSR